MSTSKPYAANTSVSPEKSRAEIETLLKRYGAQSFAYGSSPERAIVGFQAHGRSLRFVVKMPDPQDKRFARDGRGSPRSPLQRQAAIEQEVRRLWRALALAIKAKLEAVQSGIATFEDEFLAYTVLPGGVTVGEELHPKIAAAIKDGRLNAPLLMLGPGPQG